MTRNPFTGQIHEGPPSTPFVAAASDREKRDVIRAEMARYRAYLSSTDIDTGVAFDFAADCVNDYLPFLIRALAEPGEVCEPTDEENHAAYREIYGEAHSDESAVVAKPLKH